MSSGARLILLAASVVACAVVAVLALPHDPAALRAALAATGVAAPVVAVAVWVVLTPALVSGTLLAVASGLAFGAAVGGAVSALGALLGGLAAFALARGGGRTAVEHLLGRRLGRVRSLLDRAGFGAVLVARLAPGVPATLLHYAAGVTRVRSRDVAGALAIGAALRTAPYALVGAGLGTRSATLAAVAAASVAIGAAAATVLAVRLRRRPAATVA